MSEAKDKQDGNGEGKKTLSLGKGTLSLKASVGSGGAAPAAPVPLTMLTVTTVVLSVASVTPLLRTCTTGCVANGADVIAPAGCVATNSVRTGGGGGLPPPLLLPPPPPLQEASEAQAHRTARRGKAFSRMCPPFDPGQP